MVFYVRKQFQIVAGVLWDVDGSLIDNEWLHREKLTTVAARPLDFVKDRLHQKEVDHDLGVEIKPEDWHDLHGIGDHGVYEWIKGKNKHFPLSEQAFLIACEAHYGANVHRLKPRRGAMEAFNHFAARNIPQAAVSSGTRHQVNLNLDAIGLTDRMLFSISADDVNYKKPHPEPYQIGHATLIDRVEKAEDSLRDPGKITVIEDSPSGAKAGTAFGARVIYWKNKRQDKPFPDAHHTVRRVPKFHSLIQRLAPAA